MGQPAMAVEILRAALSKSYFTQYSKRHFPGGQCSVGVRCLLCPVLAFVFRLCHLLDLARRVRHLRPLGQAAAAT